MAMDLVFVLRWVKSVIGCILCLFHLSVLNPDCEPHSAHGEQHGLVEAQTRATRN